MLRVLLLSLVLMACKSPGSKTIPIRIGEVKRSYIEYVPKQLEPESPAPLLLLFHGGGGTAKKAERAFGFDVIADQHGILLAYPDGIEGHWNDGRGGAKFKAQDAQVDDLAYAASVIGDMKKRHRVDPDRIYAMGVSNGGMFVQRLAIEQSETFAAVASIISSIPEPLGQSFHPKHPVSVLFMNGTEDPLVPFEGGEVVVQLFPRFGKTDKQKGRGRVLGVEQAVGLWVELDQLGEEPRSELLPDTDAKDGAHIEALTWSSPSSKREVKLIKVIGGGHTLPGSRSFMPERIVGRTCGDIQAATTVWDFLEDKRR